MTVSAEIYGHIQQPRQRNILSDFANVVGIQQGQQQNELGRLRIADFDRSNQERNSLADIWKGAVKPDGTVDQRAVLSGAASRGLGAQVPVLQEGFTKQAKAQSDLRAQQLTEAKQRIALAGSAFKDVADNPSPERAFTALDYLGQNGVYTPEQVAGFKAKVQAEPHRVGEMAMLAYRASLDADKQLAQHFTRNLGGTSLLQAFDPVTAKAQILSNDAITQSPDNLASNQQSDANNRRSVGAQYAFAGSNRDAAAITAAGNRDAAKLKWNSETEMKLADDYRAQSKGFNEANSAYKQITASLDSATKSPAATLAAATKFMKILDPGSVVRESELGMALAATGVIDRMANYVNTLQRGKVLTPNQVADFKDISAKIYGAAQQVQQRLDADYQAKATKYGLRPDMVTQNIGQNDKLQSPDTAPAPTSSGWSIQRIGQ